MSIITGLKVHLVTLKAMVNLAFNVCVLLQTFVSLLKGVALLKELLRYYIQNI